jgi:hypothetical protein
MNPIRLRNLWPLQDFRLYTRLSSQQVLQRVYDQTEKRGRFRFPPFTKPIIKVFEGTLSQHGFELDWLNPWERSLLGIEASLHAVPDGTTIEMRFKTAVPAGYVLGGIWVALATVISVVSGLQQDQFPFGVILVPVAGIAVYAIALGIFKMRCRRMHQYFMELLDAKPA